MNASRNRAQDSQHIFARNLGHWLNERGITQSDLARRLGKGPPVVSQWLHERSGPDLATLGKIAKILAVPIVELFRDDEKRSGARTKLTSRAGCIN